MAERIPQSVVIRVPLQAKLASDHTSPATGKTVAVTISKGGGAYGNPSAGATNAVEIASGSYYVDLSALDTETLGPLFVRGTAALMDDVIEVYSVAKATNGGWSALPDAVAGAVDGLALGAAAGRGAIAWTYTLTDSVTAAPIADADVWVTSDEAGISVIASGRTSQAGAVTFNLDAGSVFVWRQKSGYNFTNPDGETVS